MGEESEAAGRAGVGLTGDVVREDYVIPMCYDVLFPTVLRI